MDVSAHRRTDERTLRKGLLQLWVKSPVLDVGRRLPDCPQQRTSMKRRERFRFVQQRTHARVNTRLLLDQVVAASLPVFLRTTASLFCQFFEQRRFVTDICFEPSQPRRLIKATRCRIESTGQCQTCD